MKQFILAVAAVVALTACNNDDNAKTVSNDDILGQWKLIEVLADPGNGSGTFNPVTSDKTVTFKTNGEITSSAGLCLSPDGSNNNTSGTFNPENQTITTDCNPYSSPVSYEIARGELILHFISNEGYSEKYTKLQAK